MEPGEALSTASQIAVALAGFAGVVVVFRRESVQEWSGVDKLRLRFLLTNSILPLGLCMLGLLLLTVKPMPPGIWRWCSGVAFVVFFRNYKRKSLSAFEPASGQTRAASPVSSSICLQLSARHCSSCNCTTRCFSARSGHSSPGLFFN
jgi:drug/metabolite transporter (DMT)-like permease